MLTEKLKKNIVKRKNEFSLKPVRTMPIHQILNTMDQPEPQQDDNHSNNSNSPQPLIDHWTDLRIQQSTPSVPKLPTTNSFDDSTYSFCSSESFSFIDDQQQSASKQQQPNTFSNPYVNTLQPTHKSAATIVRKPATSAFKFPSQQHDTLTFSQQQDYSQPTAESSTYQQPKASCSQQPPIKKFYWTVRDNVELCKIVLDNHLFSKTKTERDGVWENITKGFQYYLKKQHESSQSSNQPTSNQPHILDCKSINTHFNYLYKQFKAKEKVSRRASGVQEEYNELDNLLQDIKDKEASGEEIRAASKASTVAEQRAKGEQIRDSATRTHSEETRQKRRRVGNVNEIIKDKMEMEMKLRGEQLQLSREQNQTHAKQVDAMLSMNEQFIKVVNDQMLAFKTTLQDQQQQFQNKFLELQKQNNETQKQNTEMLKLILQMQSKSKH